MKISPNDVIFKYYEDEPYNEHRISYFGWESKSQELAFYNYILGYKTAADSIYKSFKTASIEGRIDIQDTICFPLCFIYRHIIELYLKLFYIKYLKQTDVDLMKFIKDNGHRLDKLWENIRPEIDRLLKRVDSDIDLLIADHYIKEIDGFDNDSFNFRYPIKKDTNMIHDACKVLDIPIMNERMSSFIEYMERIRREIHIQLEKFPIEQSKVDCINDTYVRSKNSYLNILAIYEKNKDSEDTEADLLDDLFYNQHNSPLHNITQQLASNQKVLLLLLMLSGKDLIYHSCTLATDASDRREDFYKLLISNIQSGDIDFDIKLTDFFNRYFEDKICSINPTYGYNFLRLALTEMDKCIE